MRIKKGRNRKGMDGVVNGGVDEQMDGQMGDRELVRKVDRYSFIPYKHFFIVYEAS